MFALTNRGEMSQTVENEFEHLTTRMKGLWLEEHNEDGTHSLDASTITSGVLSLDRIPALDAARIPNLDASKITSGIFDIARIPTDVNPTGNTIPKRDPNGHLYAAHLNSTDNDIGAGGVISYLMCKQAGQGSFLRSAPQAAVRTFLGLGNAAYINASETVVGSTIPLRHAFGYLFGNYFNSTDDVSGSPLTYLMGKFGDNYLRSATADKVRTFWSTSIPTARLQRNGGVQSVGTTGSAAWVVYDSWVHNPTPSHSYGSPWLFFPVAGYYFVSASIRWTNQNEAGMRAIRIWKNAGTALVGESIGPASYDPSAAISRAQHCNGIVYINPGAGDYIGVWVFTQGNVAATSIEYAELNSFLIRE